MVHRLERVEKIVRRKVFNKSRFDKKFYDFMCFFAITLLKALSAQNEYARLLHM